MAGNQHKIGVTLDFKANTQSAQTALQQLQNQLTNITAGNVGPNVNVSQIQQASAAAKELQYHLTAATDVNTGKLDLSKFSASLSSAKLNLSDLSGKLLNAGATGQQAFVKLASTMAQANASTFQLNGALGKLVTSLKNVATWQISSGVIMGIMSSVSQAFNYVKDLNESLNNIRIVTGESAENMKKFAKEANKAAKELSTTTNEYAKASLIYYQQGLTDKQVKERTDLTIKMANVTSQSAQAVSDQLTAVWNNFAKGGQNLEYYIDVMVALGAATASSSTEISEGLNKFAAVGETVGLSFDYAAAALATVTATTRQSADVVGTAFKTLFARIQDLELGNKLEDGTTLGQYSEALYSVGINIKTASGDLKDMNTILDEMGAKWSTLSADAQVALAQSVAGVRQYTQLMALMENWDYFKQNVNVAQESEGTLDEQTKTYAESWKAASKEVTASLETLYDQLLSDEFFIDLLKVAKEVVDIMSTAIDKLGGVKTLITGIIGIVMTSLSHKITPAVNSLITTFRTLTPKGAAAVADQQTAAFRKQIDEVLARNQGLAESEQMQLRNSSEMIRLKERLAKQVGHMTDAEKRVAEAELEAIQLRDDAMVRYQEQIESIDKKRDEEQKKLRTTVELLRTAADAESARAKAATEAQRSQQINRNVKQTDLFFNKKQAAEVDMDTVKAKKSSLETALGTTPAGSKRRLEIEQQIIELKGQEAKLDAEIKMYKNNLNALAEERNKLGLKAVDMDEKGLESLRQQAEAAQTNIQKQQDMYEQLANSAVASYKRISQEAMNSNSSQQTTGVLNGTATVKTSTVFTKDFISASTGAEQLKKKVLEIQNLLSKAGVDIKLDEKLQEAAQKGEPLEQQIKDINAELDKSEINSEQLRQILSALGQGGTIAPLDAAMREYATKVDKAEKEVEELKQKLKEAEEQNKKLRDGFNPKHKGGTLEGLSSMAGAATSAVFAIKSLVSIVDTLGDDSLSTGEKISTVITTFLMAVPMIISAFKGLSAAAAAFNASLGVIGLIALAVVAAIAALIAIADAFKNAQMAELNALNAANDELKKQNELVEQLKSSYEALKDTIESYTETQKKIDEMVVGTKEWNEAVLESNESVLKLLNQFPELQKWVTSVNGRLQIKAEGLEFIEQQQFGALTKGYAAKQSAQIAANNAQIRYDESTLIKSMDTFNSQDFIGNVFEKAMQGFVKGGATGLVVGAGAGVADSIKQDSQSAKNLTKAMDELDHLFDEDGAEFIKDYNRIVSQVADGDKELKQALLESKDSIVNLFTSNERLEQQNQLLREEVAKNTLALLKDTTDKEDPILAAMLAKAADKDSAVYQTNANAVKNSNYSDTDLSNDYLKYQNLNDGSHQIVSKDGKFYLQTKNEHGAFSEDSQVEVNKEFMQQFVIEQKTYEQLYKENSEHYQEYANELLYKIKKFGASQMQNESDEDYNNRLVSYATQIVRGDAIDLSSMNIQEVQALEKSVKQSAGNSDDDVAVALRTAIEGFYNSFESINKNATEKHAKNFEVQDSKEQADAYTGAGLNRSGFEFFTENYKKYQSYADEMAEQALRVSNSAIKVREVVEENWEALETRDVKNPKFIESINSMRESLTSWLGVDLGYDYTIDNLDNIIEAIGGAEEEIVKLSYDAADSYIQTLNIEKELESTMSSTVEFMRGLEETGQLIDGVSVRNLGLKDTFFDFEQAVLDGQMSSEALDRIFKQLGFDLEIITNEAHEFVGIDWDNTFYAGFSEGAALLNSRLDSQRKSLDELIERYHYIKEQLDDINRELDQITKAKEKAFGANKLYYLDQEIAKTEQLRQAEEQYLREIEVNFKKDREVVLSYGVETDSAGRVSNYEEIIEKWNNALPEEEVEKRIKDLEQYEETLNLMETQKTVLVDLDYQQVTQQLEKINTSLELEVKISDNSLKYLQYQLENLKDPIQDAVEAINILGQVADENLSKTKAYGEALRKTLSLSFTDDQINTLLDTNASEDDIQQILSGSSLSQEQVDALEKYREQLYTTNKSLREFYSAIKDKVIAAIKDQNKDLNESVETLDRQNKVLTSYKNIIDLVGVKTLGVTSAALKELAAAKTLNEKTKLEALKAEQDVAEANLQSLQKAKEQRALEGASEEELKNWDSMINEAETSLFKLQNDVNSAWEGTLKTISDEFTNAVELAAQSFEEAMTGVYDSYEALQAAFDQQSEIGDRYLDDYKKIYELSKLNRQLNESIDETESVKSKKQLMELQKEINDLQESDTQLSEYDLEYLQKKYDLRVAEIALEEAQNAKSQVRMRRDSEGNWGYVYTADEEATAGAEQKYEDALYAMQELSQNYIDTTQSQIIASEKEMMEALSMLRAEDFASEEEYQNEVLRITEYYAGKRNYYVSEMDKALKNSAIIYEEDWQAYHEKTGYKISDDAEWRDEFQETEYSILTNFKTMDEANSAFTISTGTMVTTIIGDFVSMKNNIAETVEAMGLSLNGKDKNSFASNLQQVTKEAQTDTKEIKDSIVEMRDEAVKKFGEIVGAAQSNYLLYDSEILKFIASNDSLITSLNSVIAKYAELKTAQSGVEQDYSATGGGGGSNKGSNDSSTSTYTLKGNLMDPRNTSQVVETGMDVKMTKQQLSSLERVSANSEYFKYRDRLGSTYQIHEDDVKKAYNELGIEYKEKEKKSSTYTIKANLMDPRNSSVMIEEGISINVPEEDTAKIKRIGQTKYFQYTDKNGNKYQIPQDEVRKLFSWFNVHYQEATPQVNTQAVEHQHFAQNDRVKLKFSAGNIQTYYFDGTKYVPMNSDNLISASYMSYNTPTGGFTVKGTFASKEGKEYLQLLDPRYESYVFDINDFMPFDTGGYTGSWDSSGRLALLHQKEIVLNAHDTENFLAAINIVRDIASAIDLRAAAQQSALAALVSTTMTPTTIQTLQQEVTIHAEFPNARERTEIEAAFDTLLNRASQFANRKN